MTNYKKAIKELKSKPKSKDEITLKPVLNTLSQLGRPEKDYPVILVGGTNGKGSTVEIISELLQSNNKDVGVSKSPHLISARERIKINDVKINEKNFVDYYNQIKNTDQDLTFFEFIIAMAYLHFSEKNVDYAVMEVGLGGEFDATNAAEADLSVITNVGNDHSHILGETREEIAQEKAGITPEDGKIVTDVDLEPIKQMASDRGSEIIQTIDLASSGENYGYKGREFKIPLKGDFQTQNLESALTAVQELEKLPEDLTKALSGLECPGRMETVSQDPKIILDGAHNPAAIRKILPDLPDDFTCVFNATKTKDIEKMIQLLEEKASSFVLTRSDVQWSKEPEKIDNHTSKPSKIVRDPRKAVEKASELEEPIVVTGSLYLIGALKKSQTKEKAVALTIS